MDVNKAVLIDRFTTKENPKAELLGCIYCS